MLRPAARTYGLCLLLVCAGAGCAAKKPAQPAVPPVGSVAFTKIEAPSEEGYKVASGEHYAPPQAFHENAFPTYPAELLEKRLPPVSVKVRLVIDAGGRVVQVEPLDSADPGDPAFFAAVEAVTREWRYMPLVRVVEGEGRTDVVFHGLIATYDGKATALPFREDYEFTFTQRDGRGFVETRAPN